MKRKFLKVISIEEARKTVSEAFTLPHETQKIPLGYTNGRYVSSDIYAKNPVPPFSKSLVDGFAIKASSSKGTSTNNPNILNIVGSVKMGEKPDFSIDSMSAAFIPTGGMLPAGADGVVMIENAEQEKDNVFVFKEIAKFENVLKAGSDVSKGELLLKQGERISPRNIGVLKATGNFFVPVVKPIKIGVLSTGDELWDEDRELFSGKIYDYNRITLLSQIKEDGFVAVDYGIINDEKERIVLSLSKAVKETDLVIMSGGTSKGSLDFTVDSINSLGRPGVIVHGLNLSPGKPTVIGVVNGKLIVGLSGNPLASYVVYRILIRGLIFQKLGIAEKKTTVRGILLENLPSRKGRAEIALCRIVKKDNNIYFKPVFSDSSFTGTLSKSDGFIYVPENLEGYAKEETVEMELW